MKKKIIVLAIAAAFSAPAFADNGNIAWYGTVFLNAESVKNDKITAPSKDSALRVLSNASRLGIKGTVFSNMKCKWMQMAQTQRVSAAALVTAAWD